MNGNNNKQPKSILDPSFQYTSSADTDLRKTFARIRRERRRNERKATNMKMPAVFRNQRA